MANQKSSNAAADVDGVADRLHSASIHLLRRVRKVDEASGLSPARLSALSVLVFGGPVTLGELARAEQVAAPTMSRLVAALEREGLAARDRDERDARAILVRATAKGRRILTAGRQRRVRELAALLEGLSPAEIETLAAAAGIVEQTLGRPGLPLSASSTYPGRTAERRWSERE